jgi:hypothetical protein
METITSLGVEVKPIGIKECLSDVEDILNKLEQAQAKSEALRQEIKFLKVSDVAKILGINTVSARAIFHRPDFPCCDYGKEMTVEITAFKNYFQKAVRKGDFEE